MTAKVPLRASAFWRRVLLLADGGATTSQEGLVEKATQAEMEAETADKYPDAANLKHHPGVAKAWAQWNVSGTIQDSYNVDSVTDNGAGDWTVNIDVDMSSADYAGFCNGGFDFGGVGPLIWLAATQGAGTFRVRSYSTAGALTDPNNVDPMFVAFGDQ